MPSHTLRRQRAKDLNAMVKRVVDDADPEDLLAQGSPGDEYEPEIDRIAARLHTLSEPSQEAIEAIVLSVWAEMFGPFDADCHARYVEWLRPVVLSLRDEMKAMRAGG